VSRAKSITLVFGIVAIIVLGSTLTIFYFAVIQGAWDHLFLKKINEKAPFVLKWKTRTFLNFNDLEITKGKWYFYAPELKANLKFEWPDKLYISINKVYGEFLESPVWARGKIGLEKKYFTLSSRFDRIDMEALTATLNFKKFGGRGKWKGSFDLSYQDGMGFTGEGRFKLISSGGALKAIFLKDLIRKMPEGDARDRLLQGLGEDEYFSLDKGGMEFYIKGEDIKIKSMLEGEKGLFDFTINLPTSLVERFWKGKLI